jgi:ribosomal protein L12E/L44/L45/RPP1/RPP2
MAVSIAMNGMEERSMSPAQLDIINFKRAFAEQQHQIDARNAEIPKMLRQQIETGMKDFEDIEIMAHTLRKQQVSILRGVNLAKVALGEEPLNPRASPLPTAAAAASAAVPAPVAMRPPTYKSALGIPVEKPKKEEDEEDEDDTEQNDDGFKKIEYKKSGGGGSQVNVKTCRYTDDNKHCHNADCKYTHPKGYQPGPRTICRNWNDKACTRGKDCWFLHAKKCPYEDGPNFKEEK